MRVAIAHDYLTQRGGAERVVAAMHRAFPAAPIYTSVFRPSGTFHDFDDVDVRTTWLDRMGPFREHHRTAFPFLAPTFSSLRIDADVVLCSSSGWAHGVRTTGAKVVYCHNPARWLYQSAQYGSVAAGSRAAAALGRRPLRRWDRRAAASATAHLVNSRAVQARVRSAYGISAEVLPPPVAGPSAQASQRPLAGLTPGFFLAVGRLLPYKKVDAVAAAFRLLPGERLVVVGDGPARAEVHAAAGDADVVFLSEVPDDELRWLYSNCAGMVSASFEDFGLTPLEAASYGRPGALLRWGGFLDTVVESSTGVFFDEPTPVAIADAVRRLRAQRWDPEVIARHGARFGEPAFIDRLRQVVTDAAELAA